MAIAAKTSTAIGAFVLGALALGVIAILVFGGRNLFSPKLRVVAYFQNSVAGLAIGAPVTLRGVQIGTVSSMKVYLKLPELVPVIPVYMDIEPTQVSWTSDPLTAGASDLDLAIKAGLRAQLATTSLVTGQVSVNLDFYPNTVAKVSGESGGVTEIPTIPSDLQQVKNEIEDLKLPDLVERARTALAGINEIIGEMTGRVGPLVDSVRQTSDAAHVTLDTATGAVKQVQQDASRALDSIDHLSKTTEGEVKTAGKEIASVATSADKTVGHADKVVGNLGDLTAPRSPLRDDLEAAARDLAASAASLRNFSRTVEEKPNAILLGRDAR
jgi:paraquat-inducible protein B